MNLHIFESLSFLEAVLWSSGVASVSALAFAVFLIRRKRKNGGNSSGRPVLQSRIRRMNSYPRENRIRQSGAMPSSLRRKLDELDSEISGCLEMIRSVVNRENMDEDAGGYVQSENERGSGVVSEIRRLRDRGMDEKEMGKRLNVSSEMLEIYLRKERSGTG